MPEQQLSLLISDELMRAVRKAAEHDVDMVWGIMHHLGDRAGRPNLINEVSFDFVIQLGAALRLLFWEWNEIYIHRDAGLPDALDALRNVFRTAKDVEAATKSASLPFKVFALLVERLSWTGPEDLDADFILGEVDEDALLNAMADFVWDHRRDLPNESNTTKELP